MARVEKKALSRELGRLEARLERMEQAQSSPTREVRDRRRAELEAERGERRRLQEQLEEARTGAERRLGFCFRLFGS